MIIYILEIIVKTIALVLIICTTLAACGGGGGGTSSNSESQSTPLTAQNYPLATTEVMASSATLNSSSDFANSLIGTQVQAPVPFTGFVQSNLPNLIKNWRTDKPLFIGALTSSSADCTSGRLDASYNDIAGNDLPDAGDSITIVAVNCVNSGTKLNGQMSITFTKFAKSATSDDYEASIHASSSQFASETGGVSTTSNGSFDMDIISKDVLDNTGTHPLLGLKIIISSLNYNITSANSTKVYEYRNYVVDTSTYNGRVSQTINGSINIPSLGSNTATVETIASFESATANAAYPTSGIALITFKQGGKIRATANGTSSALVELDLNNDGVFETSNNIPWSDIF